MKKKILVVEDDRDILMTIHELLEGEGYTSVMASGGPAALEILRGSEILPDLIVLDYTMPEMDGAEFRAEQEKDGRLASIPVFLITADGHPDVKKLKVGARAFMKKPFDVNKFLEAVKTCLQ